MNDIDILTAWIREETGYKKPIDADEDLIQAGILDSFNIISLAMFVQERFGVEFEAEDLVRDNLARLSNLMALIKTRTAAA